MQWVHLLACLQCQRLLLQRALLPHLPQVCYHCCLLSQDLEREGLKVRTRLCSLVWHTDIYRLTPQKLLPTVPQAALDDVATNTTICFCPDLFKIVLPINVNLFKFLLVAHPNCPLVMSVCHELCAGFWLMAQHEAVDSVLADNSACPHSTEQLTFLMCQYENKVTTRCFSPCFGADLLLAMYSFLLFAVPKPD